MCLGPGICHSPVNKKRQVLIKEITLRHFFYILRTQHKKSTFGLHVAAPVNTPSPTLRLCLSVSIITPALVFYVSYCIILCCYYLMCYHHVYIMYVLLFYILSYCIVLWTISIITIITHYYYYYYHSMYYCFFMYCFFYSLDLSMFNF